MCSLAVSLCLVYSSTHRLLRAPPRAGLMQEMVTITHNSRCAEMLATVRRGPFARSTQEERIEFLLTRMKKQDCKVAFGDHALEHVLLGNYNNYTLPEITRKYIARYYLSGSSHRVSSRSVQIV